MQLIEVNLRQCLLVGTVIEEDDGGGGHRLLQEQPLSLAATGSPFIPLGHAGNMEHEGVHYFSHAPPSPSKPKRTTRKPHEERREISRAAVHGTRLESPRLVPAVEAASDIGGQMTELEARKRDH
ncbi:hypothetical protein NHX12_003270 [Muraenolepis orangiensis]|uniref:Uncharacterized protein n=1 Tax=Muraenolepis orangiensis TaxID=630683 RepID=A0A9Q0E121_9TELE|nr:hypothetical protein NHX12_003270 [Muraenolepis orangiensis]